VTGFHDIQDIISDYAKCNDDTLTYFDSIDAGEDIDCIRAENTQKRHISIIKPAYESTGKVWKIRLGGTKIDESGQVGEKGFRSDHYGDIEVDVIDHEERYRCNGREKNFMSPADIEDIVGESENGHTLQT
jgi:hypothetical protein